MTGEDVRRLQEMLNARGFTVASSGPGAPGSETAYFGPLTQAALVKLQTAHDDDILAASGAASLGTLGHHTRTYLNQS